MALFCIVGAVSAVVYGVSLFKMLSVAFAACMVFLFVFCIASLDVLSEGYYRRLMRRYPVPGAYFASCILAFIVAGQVIEAAILLLLSELLRLTIGIFASAGL